MMTLQNISRWLTTAWLLLSALSAQAAPLSYAQALNRALQQDFQAQRWQALSDAALQQAHGADSWDDPMLSLKLANVPVDDWALDQEPMTQVMLGVQQWLPRGDSLSLQQQFFQLQSEQAQWQQQLRRLWLSREVGRLWIKASWAWQAQQQLTEQKQSWQQLRQVVLQRYESGRSQARQQDVVAIDVQLQRLQQRLLTLRQQQQQLQAQLANWLQADVGELAPLQSSLEAFHSEAEQPDWRQHPQWQLAQLAERSSANRVAFEQQQQGPRWRLDASYGWRSNSSSNNDMPRSDFASVGVALALPMGERSSRQVRAAIARQAADSAALQDSERSLSLAYATRQADASGFMQRWQHLQQQLLPSLRQQYQLHLASYGQGRSELAELVQSALELSNAELQSLALLRDIWLSRNDLNYFHSNYPIAPAQASSDAQPLSFARPSTDANKERLP
ncbi:TolC family protein [Bacterioplanes sanyensis]|uniref:TolC family protein n=1 Tax=Bacterioplanes sanyensis TaxID=1249553 RepID=UPI001678044A|nr:TolC family protein [Bacterioplanes sanyensis]